MSRALRVLPKVAASVARDVFAVTVACVLTPFIVALAFGPLLYSDALALATGMPSAVVFTAALWGWMPFVMFSPCWIPLFSPSLKKQLDAPRVAC